MTEKTVLEDKELVEVRAATLSKRLRLEKVVICAAKVYRSSTGLVGVQKAETALAVAVDALREHERKYGKFEYETKAWRKPCPTR